MAYGKYRYSTIKGEKGNTWNVEIWKKDFNIIPSVGDDFEGGVVFKVTSTDIYVVAKENIIDGATTTFEWGCTGTSISGADGTAIGTGYQNTLDIVSGCSETDSAAYMCSDLTLNGYTDWYLPSEDELVEMYNNKSTLEAVSGFNAFGSNNYWSSSESSNLNADLVFFFNGNISAVNKGGNYYVRPIRSYSYTPPTEINLSGEGFEVAWNGQGGTRDTQFIASACTLNLIIENNTDETFVYDVLNSGVRNYYIRIYKGAVDVSHTNIWWYGWVESAFDVVENAPYPYEYKLNATDSYGFLNKLKADTFADEQTKVATIDTVKSSLLNVLSSVPTGSKLDVGGSTANNLNPAPDSFKFFRSISNWWMDGDYSTSANPLNKYYVSSGAYAGRTTYDEEGVVTSGLNSLQYKLQDYFNGSLKLFNLVGFLAEGVYNFIQPNSLVGYTSSTLKAYKSSKTYPTDETAEDVNLILTIDQSNNSIVDGSSLTYEPSFESVRVSYKQEESFNVPSGSDLETEIQAGYVSANSGLFTLDYRTKNFTEVLKSDFSFNNDDHDIFSNTFTTTSALTIKLTDGIDDYYLQTETDSDTLVWTVDNSSALSIDIIRGYQADAPSNPLNTEALVPYGGITNAPEFTSADQSSNMFVWGGCYGNSPCKRNPDYISSGNIYCDFETLLRFECNVQSPPISGMVTIKTQTSNVYYQRDITGFVHVIDPFIHAPPTPTSNITNVITLSLTPSEENASNNAGADIEYKAIQTETAALESVDLGSVMIGQTTVNDLYAVKYYDTPNYPPVIDGFRRGNTGLYKNILQLRVNEFLQLQTKPLEILQANIQSADISPLKIIKYSINDDGSYKYYTFLGGSFKARSEIMSGEWYKVDETTPTISEPDPEISSEFRYNPERNNIVNIPQAPLSPNILGVTDAAYGSNVSVIQISLAANVEGKYYNNQVLYLASPDGSSPVEITCSASKKGVDYVDINAFQPPRDYPIGSLILVKSADLTNVISSNISYPATEYILGGAVANYINITPNEFSLTNRAGTDVNTNDNGGSVRISDSSQLMYAIKIIPQGTTATKVNVFGSSGFAFRVYSGELTNDTTTLLGSGVVNTELDITDLLGTSRNYLAIEINTTSTSDEVYGAYITIE